MGKTALYWIDGRWQSLEVDNTDRLDNLDSTDFALKTHKHTTSDIVDFDAKNIAFNNADTSLEATKVEDAIKEVFHFANDTVNNMQGNYAAAIVGKGGSVTKEDTVYTEKNIIDGINSITGGGVAGTESEIFFTNQKALWQTTNAVTVEIPCVTDDVILFACTTRSSLTFKGTGYTKLYETTFYDGDETLIAQTFCVYYKKILDKGGTESITVSQTESVRLNVWYAVAKNCQDVQLSNVFKTAGNNGTILYDFKNAKNALLITDMIYSSTDPSICMLFDIPNMRLFEPSTDTLNCVKLQSHYFKTLPPSRQTTITTFIGQRVVSFAELCLIPTTNDEAYDTFAKSIETKGGTVKKATTNYSEDEINKGILSIPQQGPRTLYPYNKGAYDTTTALGELSFGAVNWTPGVGTFESDHLLMNGSGGYLFLSSDEEIDPTIIKDLEIVYEVITPPANAVLNLQKAKYGVNTPALFGVKIDYSTVGMKTFKINITDLGIIEPCYLCMGIWGGVVKVHSICIIDEDNNYSPFFKRDIADIEIAITQKDGEVNKVNKVATKDEIVAGIASIAGPQKETIYDAYGTPDYIIDIPSTYEQKANIFTAIKNFNTKKLDLTARGFTGTLSTTGINPEKGCVSFDGVSQGLELPEPGNFVASGFTIFIAYKTTHIAPGATWYNLPSLFCKATNGTGYGDIGVCIQNGYLYYWDDANNSFLTQRFVADGELHIAALTYRPGKTILYDETGLLYQNTASFGSSAVPYGVFSGQSSTDLSHVSNSYLKGDLYGFSLFKKVLGKEEVMDVVGKMHQRYNQPAIKSFTSYSPLYKTSIDIIENAIIYKGGTIVKAENTATEAELKSGILSIPTGAGSLYDKEAILEIEKAIINQSGLIDKVTEIATKDDLIEGIQSIETNVVLKQKLIDTLVLKSAQLEGILTLETPIDELIKYVMLLGNIVSKIKDEIPFTIIEANVGTNCEIIFPENIVVPIVELIDANTVMHEITNTVEIILN